jgi:hypothetical protein
MIEPLSEAMCGEVEDFFAIAYQFPLDFRVSECLRENGIVDVLKLGRIRFEKLASSRNIVKKVAHGD